MIYRCGNCKNRHNCCENKEQYEKTCEIIDTVARGIDRLPDCCSYYTVIVKCDYWEEDKKMDEVASDTNVGSKGVKIPVMSMKDICRKIMCDR